MRDAVWTRIPPDARLPTKRTLDEQAYVRWPRLYAALSRAVLALPPRSRVKRALLRRNAISAWGAWARGDIELTLARYTRDFRLEPPREFVAMGIRSSYEGHAAIHEWSADMREAWERMDVRPVALADAGNTVVTLSEGRLRARSGVEFDYKLGSVFSTERGLISDERDFADWEEALREAGIKAPAGPGAGAPA
jgi:ketosteroid isomerase-like protein